MNATTYNAWHPRHLGYVIIFTALITGSLFAALPWLTRIADREPGIERMHPYIVLSKTQPKPPEPVRDERIIEQKLQLPPKPTLSKSTRQDLKRDFGFLTGKEGFGKSVHVTTLDPDLVSFDPKEIVFVLRQLDKEPRIIRKVPPAYPFTAKSRGITARVKIRCIVDKDGNPQKVMAAECDPEDALDIFGPPAVEAVKKWRFNPGEIGRDPVPTKVVFNLFFELD
ncbi:MAG: energy transducer TonB [Deltaproteobacteria bacterium]|nr:energy transducer TonB [Deltaproteobacteria bacterium]